MEDESTGIVFDRNIGLDDLLLIYFDDDTSLLGNISSIDDETVTINDKIILEIIDRKFNADWIWIFFAVKTVSVFTVPNNATPLKIAAIPKNQWISPYCSGSICEARKNQKTADKALPKISPPPIAPISFNFFIVVISYF